MKFLRLTFTPLLLFVLITQLVVVSSYAQVTGTPSITTTPSGSPVVNTGGGSTTSTSCALTKVGTPPGEAPQLPPECLNGGSTGGGGIAGPCQAAPPPPSDIKAAILSKWGITLNITEAQLPYAWDEFYKIDCTGFLQDLSGTLVNSWSQGYAQQFSCPGSDGDQGPTDVMFSDQWTGAFMEAILVHELTHVWQHCSSRGEQNLLDNDSAYEGEGGLTKYSRNECPNFTSNTPNKEDHADTIALYLNPEQGELTCGDGAPNPFTSGGHPLHKTSAEKGVGKK